eukprot:scaffold29195_cov69-Cyclotella_meneghiniana.AAC.19
MQRLNSLEVKEDKGAKLASLLTEKAGITIFSPDPNVPPINCVREARVADDYAVVTTALVLAGAGTVGLEAI